MGLRQKIPQGVTVNFLRPVTLEDGRDPQYLGWYPAHTTRRPGAMSF